MSDESRPHLKLSEHKPLEDRTFTGGVAGSYQRTEYKQHASKIFKEAQILSQFRALMHIENRI